MASSCACTVPAVVMAGQELPGHVEACPRPLGRKNARCAEDLGQLKHHAPDGPQPDDADALPDAELRQLQAVQGACQRLGDCGLGEAEAVGDRGHRAVVQRGGVQDHALLETARELVADGVVDGAVGARIARTPPADPAGHVGAQRDAVAGLHAGDRTARFQDNTRNLVPDNGRRLHPVVAKVEDADVGAAHGAGVHLEDRLVIAACRFRDIFHRDRVQCFEQGRFHPSLLWEHPV
jgi:hypothetical protein